MRITIGDCGDAAASIYKNENFGEYLLLDGVYDPKNEAVGWEGYSVGLYKRKGSVDTFIISARGSAKGKLTKDWTDDDVSIGVGRTPDRYAAGLQFTQRVVASYPGNHIIVGHSLGGHIAQMVGVVCDLPFVTFNAPPAIGTWSGQLPNKMNPATFKKGLNYRVNWDPVSKCSGTHVGPLITLKLNGVKGFMAAHKKTTYQNSLLLSGLRDDGAIGSITRANLAQRR